MSAWEEIKALHKQSTFGAKEGIAFLVRVSGKKQTPWCRSSKMDDSDGLRVWIDTRNNQDIHRASRFCHQFIFLPFGSGRKMDEPVASLVKINRAKEHPKAVDAKSMPVISSKRADGYELQAFIPADAMTGYDPQEHKRLGFSYAVVDRELGWQTVGVGPEFPFIEDPSLWVTMNLDS